MLREGKGFEGVLTRFGVKAKEDGHFIAFNIRYTCPGDVQIFLDSFEEKCGVENIRRLFTYPIQWKNIQIDTRERFEVTFDEVLTEAVLHSIKVKRAIPKKLDAKETFTYDLSFEKMIDTEDDLRLGIYLNQKEEDENGKKKPMLFLVYLESMGAEQEKIKNLNEQLEN